jgi:hypothetical protein
VPDVKGKWIGKTHTILVGKGGHWPNGRGTWDKPALLEKDPVIDITGQDEPFIGELTGKDNRNFVFADTDGFWEAQLDGGDTLSFCYWHTGSSSTIVSCTEVKRTR